MIHDAVTDSVHVLSPTARMVYESARAGKTGEETVQVIRLSFTVPEDRDVLQDVLRCLGELRAKGLVD